MRKLLFAAAAAASALGGAMIAQGVQAQPYGYYAPAPVLAPGYRYDEFGRPLLRRAATVRATWPRWPAR